MLPEHCVRCRGELAAAPVGTLYCPFCGKKLVRQPRPKARPASVPAPLQELPLYREDAKLCDRWDVLVEEWRRAFPDVDIYAEIAKAHAWEQANRLRRNRPAFLNHWFSKAQWNAEITCRRLLGAGPRSASGNGDRPRQEVSPDVAAFLRRHGLR